MKPRRLPQELCQAYLSYQVLQGGIFSTGGCCVEEEGKDECLQGKSEAQQGQQGPAPDSSIAAVPL